MNYQSKSSFLEINQSWHIPRASLGSGSSNGSTSANGSHLSHSNASSVKHGKRRTTGRRATSGSRRNTVDSGDGGHKNRGYLSDGDGGGGGGNASAECQERRGRRSRRADNVEHHYNQQQSNVIGLNPNGVTAAADFVAIPVGGVKRSSQSSQGSTDSNHSSHSASSGSMLLTAANLEQLAQIHKRNELNQPTNTGGKSMLQANVERLTSTYSANITAAASAEGSPSTIISIGAVAGGGGERLKEADAMSLASSTHFTMVNGVGGPQRKHKSSLCDRGHQITVLILTMSAIFLIGICGAVFMLEMRAKKMMSMNNTSMHNE